MARSTDILILGLGNLLLSDDGIGVHAVQALAADPPPGVQIVDVGTAVLGALPHLEKARQVLALDAVSAGRVPGSLYRFSMEEALDEGRLYSIHAVGLRRAMQLLSPDVAVPQITVLGVEPLHLDYGMELSPPVKTALPELLALARQWVDEQQNRNSQTSEK